MVIMANHPLKGTSLFSSGRGHILVDDSKTDAYLSHVLLIERYLFTYESSTANDTYK